MQVTTKRKRQVRGGADVYLCRGISAHAVIEIHSDILGMSFVCSELNSHDVKHRIFEEEAEFCRKISERRKGKFQKFIDKVLNML